MAWHSTPVLRLTQPPLALEKERLRLALVPECDLLGSVAQCPSGAVRAHCLNVLWCASVHGSVRRVS